MTKTFRSASLVALALMFAWLLVPNAAAKTRRSPAASNSNPASFAFTKTFLPDGRILIAGGQNQGGRVQGALSTVNPVTGAGTILNVALRFPRAAHTSTVLPDGTVLILGGIGLDGKLVPSAELFDPVSGTVRPLSGSAPATRAFHTSTLLTDGRVLIAGGVFPNGSLAKVIELWDPRGQNSTTIVPQLAIERRGHTATLLPDGRVLFSGGEDNKGNPTANNQVFDPESQTVSVAATTDSFQDSGNALTEKRASSPEDGAQNVALNALISVRFSRPIQMATINATTVTLQGPEGIVNAKAVAAEGGMLAFVTPAIQLLPSTSYSVQIGGAVDASNLSVATATFSFSTIGGIPNSQNDETWTPTADWQTHRAPSKYELLADLQGPRGTTSLAGQVLKLNGDPLAHVTLEIGNRKAESDDTGRFLLTDLPAGHQVLVIEGATANEGAKHYGRYEFGDEIKAGVTNKLDFKIWMSLLDMAHEVTIPSPTTKETILATPTMPGLELHLPPGTVITDAKGRVVTKVTITPIPLDRPPFPLPFVKVPIYFTIQPGGAYISVYGNGPKGARLFYPNAEHKPAGVPFAFWNYNADHNGWFVYGAGRVNQARTQVVPDPGVVVYGFSGAMVGSGSPGPTTQGSAGDNSDDGEPVQLSSGLFVYNKTDLVLPDTIPISLTRTYRPNDSVSRPFGIGTTHPYEMFIGGDGTDFGTTAFIDLILPDGTRIHFVGVGSSPFTSYLHSAAGTSWYGAVISQTPINPHSYSLPGIWQLQTKDGTIFSFPEAMGLVNAGCQALVGITDRYGNQVKITRNGDANCTIAQITSPNGRSIQFQYDSSLRVKLATDNIGRQVQYTYDGSGRLQTVIDANNGTWTYGYDTQNRMTTIEDPRRITYLTNGYDSGGRVHTQTLADGTSTYTFNWTTTSNTQNITFGVNEGGGGGGGGGPAPYQVLNFRSCTTCNEGFQPLISQVDVIDPRGFTRRVVFNQNGYTTSDTRALGKPEQETTTYAYSADNLISSVTDQLGRVTTYSYDVTGNPISITRLNGTPNAVTATAEYDGFYGRPLTVTDPLGHTTNYTYDTFGNLTTLTDPLGHQVTFGYNGAGQLTSATDALNHTAQFLYDFADLIGVTDPLLNTTTAFRDGAGRIVSITDPLGHTTKYQYNPLNQITQITDPLQGVTTLSYDGNGNLLTVQDARQQGTNNKTVYTYDNFDHLQTRTDQLKRQETYVFNQLENLTSFTDRRGKVTTYQYDGISRLTFAGFGTQAGPTYESTINYTYDGGNRLSKIVDSTSGTITPVFDGLDRLTSETTPQGSVSYAYDNDNRLTTAAVAGQTSNCYTYDNANRLTGIGQGTCPVGTNTTTFTYDSANRRGTVTFANGIVLTYGYDNDSRPTSINYKLGTTEVAGITYQYDAAGRRTQFGGNIAATSFPAAVSSATYDVANQLTNWNGTTVTYDNNGNILNDGTNAYTWNGRNQLSSRASISFQYDSFGRRTLNPAGNNLLYEGWDVAQELSGMTVTANRVLGDIDEFFSRTDSTGTSVPITDALGTVLALVNSSGNITTQYQYDPFGNTTSTRGNSTNVFQYTGRENDSNGLYFYRARYYSPQFARFISEDPIGYYGGSANLYGYTFDAPTRFTDASGHCPTCIAAGLGAGVGAVIGGTTAAISGGDWKQGAVDGAIAGGVAGLTLGLGGPAIAGAFGGGAFGGAVAGAVASAAGNAAQQGFAILTGRQCSFNWGSFAIQAGAGAAFGAFALRPYTAPNQPVTSWAPEDVPPDVGPGRWGMTGDGYRDWAFSGTAPEYPYGNSATATFPDYQLSYPPGWESFKGFFGQRVIQ
jgi:RHS repeat-associated protein